MKDLTKHIREATGLSMDEFCKTYLESDWRAFSIRERKKNLYPNEALLICLVTGKNPVELFDMSSIELFCLQGKESVTKHINKILEKPDALNKLNLILNNSDGLRINPDLIKTEKPPRKKTASRKPFKHPVTESTESQEGPKNKKKVLDEDFDFVPDIYSHK